MATYDFNINEDNMEKILDILIRKEWFVDHSDYGRKFTKKMLGGMKTNIHRAQKPKRIVLIKPTIAEKDEFDIAKRYLER